MSLLTEPNTHALENTVVIGGLNADEIAKNDASATKVVIPLSIDPSSTTSPEEIPVESFQEHTAILHSASKSQHTKIYDRAAAFIGLSAEDYTQDNLLIGTQLTKEFIVTRVMVRTSAVGLATQYKINEGRLMGKVLDIHDAVVGTGREAYADEVFPYPKSTRSMYIRVGSIEGVDPYTFLGTECLRKVATAIKKTNVDGPDQIAALFEKYDEECDMSLGHREFKVKLNSILDKALNITAGSTGAGDSKTTDDDDGGSTGAGDSKTTDDDDGGSTGAGDSKTTDDDGGGSTGAGDSKTTDDDDGGSTGAGDSKTTDDDDGDSTGAGDSKTTDDDDGGSTGAGDSKTTDDDDGGSTGAGDSKTTDDDDDGSTGAGDSKTTDDDDGGSTGAGDSKTTDDDDDGSTGAGDSKTTDDDDGGSAGAGDSKTTDDDEGGSTGTADSKTTDDDGSEKKVFLNQESVNKTLATFIRSVDKLLKHKPPQYKLALTMFDDARVCLDKLEDYVKGKIQE